MTSPGNAVLSELRKVAFVWSDAAGGGKWSGGA